MSQGDDERVGGASREELNDIFQKREELKENRESVFYPSENFHELLWNVCAAWENVVQDARGLLFAVRLNFDDVPKIPDDNADSIAKLMRKCARKLNLRVPGREAWNDECTQVREIRNHLGHLLNIESLTGEYPNRECEILRVPYRATDEFIVEGEFWINKRLITVRFRERELHEALELSKFLCDTIRAIGTFGISCCQWPDSWSSGSVRLGHRWWLDDWGPQRVPWDPEATYPTMGQMRERPQEEYRDSLSESSWFPIH